MVTNSLATPALALRVALVSPPAIITPSSCPSIRPPLAVVRSRIFCPSNFKNTPVSGVKSMYPPTPIVMVEVNAMLFSICGLYRFKTVELEPTVRVALPPFSPLIEPLCSKIIFTLFTPSPIYTSESTSPNSTSPTALLITKSSPDVSILPVFVPAEFLN